MKIISKNKSDIIPFFVAILSVSFWALLIKLLIWGGTDTSWNLLYSFYGACILLPWLFLRFPYYERFSRVFNELFFFCVCVFMPLIALSIFIFPLKNNLKTSSYKTKKIKSLPKGRKKEIDFSLGDKVLFTNSSGSIITGIIGQINKKNVIVIEKPGEAWTVSPGLLRKPSKKPRSKKSVGSNPPVLHLIKDQ